PLDERIDHVREREKDVERKPLDQERQDVLRTDSLETILRAVPILEPVELQEALPIVAIRRRQLLPIFIDDEERFGPAHVTVAPDHVRNDEGAVGRERPRDRVEQVLERDQMMQRMVRDRGIEWNCGLPRVDIASLGPYL